MCRSFLDLMMTAAETIAQRAIKPTDIIKKLEWSDVKVVTGSPEMFKCIQKVIIYSKLNDKSFQQIKP